MKKVAVIGSGISGTSAAYYLNKLGFNVSLFESDSYFGGHTNTIDVEVDGLSLPVDTGFLVHNDRTYPNLIDFFNELKIETYPSNMSFSVMRKTDDITWGGTNLLTVFTQTKNLYSVRFYKFLKEVLRFNNNSTNSRTAPSPPDLDKWVIPSIFFMLVMAFIGHAGKPTDESTL